MVDGKAIKVKAAVSEALPMDVLLGKDVPEVYELLRMELAAKRNHKIMGCLTKVFKQPVSRQILSTGVPSTSSSPC